MPSFPSRHRGRGGQAPHRAQSETVGVIMLTAVIVLLVGGFGVVYLGAAGDQADEGPLINANITATADRLSVTHAAGDSIPVGDLDVLVRSDDASERYRLDDGILTNDDGDERFDPGERFRRDHGVGGGQLTVFLIHTPSNAVIEQAYLDT